MFFSLAFAALILPAVLAQAVAKPDSGIITVGSVQIKVDTVPVSPSLLALAELNGRSYPATSLSKRVVNNGCFLGCTRTCTNALSPLTPTSGDCSALQAAVQALATSEQAPPFPCNLPNQASCPNFTVAPGFERAYSLGTCLIGFANLNPSGGPSISYCDYLMAGVMPGMYSNCITGAGNTGGYCAQTQTGTYYFIEFRHT